MFLHLIKLKLSIHIYIYRFNFISLSEAWIFSKHYKLLYFKYFDSWQNYGMRKKIKTHFVLANPPLTHGRKKILNCLHFAKNLIFLSLINFLQALWMKYSYEEWWTEKWFSISIYYSFFYFIWNFVLQIATELKQVRCCTCKTFFYLMYVNTPKFNTTVRKLNDNLCFWMFLNAWHSVH